MSKLILSFIILICLVQFSYENDYKTFIENLDLNLEEAKVVTKDRYVNTVWILTSKDEMNRNGKSIILQHGLLDGAWTWLILGEKSLAYKLVQEGYVVYLPYIRGTQFSQSHLDYDNGVNSDYWNFSFDQMAQYDLPAVVELAKTRDGVEKVDYIGHSQGTLIFFLEYMNNPEYMEKNINKFIALGTVPNVNNAPHFLIKLFEKSKILNFIPVKNFMTLPPEVGQVLVPFCTGAAKSLCDSILKLAFGGLEDTGRIDYERLNEFIFLYEPGGTSLQNMKHWIQIYTAKRAQKYDFGSRSANIKAYGIDHPPVYNLNQMKGYSIPSIVTISDSDPFANPDDTLEFISNIQDPNIVKVMSLKKYNHIDYIWADSAAEEVFPEVINFLLN